MRWCMTPTRQGPDPCRSIGRDGVEYYNKLGYVPWSNVRGEPSVAEGTAKTLEYAYNDWCAALMARAAGREADAATFSKKAMNYTNVFDAKHGFRARAQGGWCVDRTLLSRRMGRPFHRRQFLALDLERIP